MGFLNRSTSECRQNSRKFREALIRNSGEPRKREFESVRNIVAAKHDQKILKSVSSGVPNIEDSSEYRKMLLYKQFERRIIVTFPKTECTAPN